MAEITLKECTDHSWIERRVLGWQWWWTTTVRFSSTQAGFARTREKAQAKAEAAARRLTANENAPYERYSYEVSDCG